MSGLLSFFVFFFPIYPHAPFWCWPSSHVLSARTHHLTNFCDGQFLNGRPEKIPSDVGQAFWQVLALMSEWKNGHGVKLMISGKFIMNVSTSFFKVATIGLPIQHILWINIQHSLCLYDFICLYYRQVILEEDVKELEDHLNLPEYELLDTTKNVDDSPFFFLTKNRWGNPGGFRFPGPRFTIWKWWIVMDCLHAWSGLPSGYD